MQHSREERARRRRRSAKDRRENPPLDRLTDAHRLLWLEMVYGFLTEEWNPYDGIPIDYASLDGSSGPESLDG